MKKLSILVFISMLTACTGCPFGTSEQAEGLVADSVAYSWTKKDVYDVSIQADYPVEGNQMLVRSVREWMNEQLGGSYSGELADTAALFAHYKSVLLDSLVGDTETVRELKEWGMTYERSMNFRRVWESDNLLTYTVNSYLFEGGNHGMNVFWGVTFRKSDGRHFDWDMVKGGLIPNDELITGLKAYFKVTTDEELAGSLLMYNFTLKTLPMPSTAPWITEEGLNLVYQPYEIAPYAAGCVTITIPTTRAQELLTATVKQEL